MVFALLFLLLLRRAEDFRTSSRTILAAVAKYIKQSSDIKTVSRSKPITVQTQEDGKIPLEPERSEKIIMNGKHANIKR